MAKLSNLAEENLQQVFPNGSHLTLNTYFYDSKRKVKLEPLLTKLPDELYVHNLILYAGGAAREEVDLVNNLSNPFSEYENGFWPIISLKNKSFKTSKELFERLEFRLNQEVDLDCSENPKKGHLRLFQLAFSNMPKEDNKYFVELTQTYATLMYAAPSKNITFMNNLFKETYGSKTVFKANLEDKTLKLVG